MSTRPNQRVFFALLPAESLAFEFRRLADSCVTDPAARCVPLASLHMTLVFCGELDLPHVELSAAAGALIKAAPFEIQFKRLEYRARQSIVWLRAEPNPPLDALVAQLRGRLIAAGVPFDSKPFLPHVTLARKARLSLEPGCDLIWPVREFALLRSTQTPSGSDYQTLARWPLSDATVCAGNGPISTD